MKKLILSLAISLMAPFAFAQTVDVQTRTDEQPRTRVPRTHESANVQVQAPTPKQEFRRETTEQRTETRREGPEVNLTFRNRDDGFRREHGPRFWRGHEHHDRGWYIATFGEPNLRLIRGCWYYRYGDCFWPAFGYDPGCAYPNGDAPICE